MGELLWLDLETTALDPREGEILEVAIMWRGETLAWTIRSTQPLFLERLDPVLVEMRQFSHGVPACRRGHSHAWQHLGVNGGDGPNARVYRCCPHCDTIQETGRGTWYTDAWDERRQIAAIQREIASVAVRA